MDFQELMNLVKNNDIQTKIFIFFIGVSLIQFFDIKIIVSIGIFIIIILNYKDLIKDNKKKDIKDDIKKNEISDDMYYNNDIHDLLIKLKNYKKYNKVSYKDGVKYMRKFFKMIHILEKSTNKQPLIINKYNSKEKQLKDKLKYQSSQIKNYNQYFDNALLYLKISINHFQSITVSLPERNYIKALKYGDYESTKKVNELGILCKEIYNKCYYILQNISIKLNKEWLNNPNIYTKEIDMNTDRVEHYNKNNEVNWSLY